MTLVTNFVCGVYILSAYLVPITNDVYGTECRRCGTSRTCPTYLVYPAMRCDFPLIRREIRPEVVWKVRIADPKIKEEYDRDIVIPVEPENYGRLRRETPEDRKAKEYDDLIRQLRPSAFR